jgi:hypothetical protein
MRNQKLILSLPNGDLELYFLIVSPYLNIVILSLTNIDGSFHYEKVSWCISN